MAPASPPRNARLSTGRVGPLGRTLPGLAKRATDFGGGDLPVPNPDGGLTRHRRRGRTIQPSRPLAPARLGARRWRGGGGVLRPRVARIATLHLGFHRGPRSLPEAWQVACDLNWAPCRRQQMEGERQLAVGDRGMVR